LGKLQRRLESKIRIISPAIDMIELITARGNTSLESALALTKSLRWDIQALGVRLAKAAANEELTRKGSSRANSKIQNEIELKGVISDMTSLLEKIEDAVPLINLAITTSGVSLSTNLPASISPSRLLQASTFLSTGDAQYSTRNARSVQIGPAFTLSMYMLFSGHSLRPHDDDGFRNTTWQEVIHKVRVKLVRTSLNTLEELPSFDDSPNGVYEQGATPGVDGYFPTSIPSNAKVDEFAYQLLFVEDLDDGRVHTLEEDEPQPDQFDDISSAGIREVIPIHQISKIFYADTGKILNIGSEGEVNNPVLLLKRDISAVPPRRMMERDTAQSMWDEEEDDIEEEQDQDEKEDKSNEKSELDELNAQFARDMSHAEEDMTRAEAPKPWRLPAGLDPEWIALEVFTEEEESDTESEVAEEDSDSSRTKHTPVASPPTRQGSVEPSLTSALSKLRLSPSKAGTPSASSPANAVVISSQQNKQVTQTRFGLAAASSSVRTSLSLLEMLVRLTSLQQFQQASHLSINDELLNFFLEESSTTGAAPGDIEARKKIRNATRARVGFDPYDESPIKRRGEQYQYHNDNDEGGWDNGWENVQGEEAFAPRTPLDARSARSPTMPRSSPSRSPFPAPVSARAMRSAQSTPIRQVNSPGRWAARSSLATPPSTFRARPIPDQSHPSRISQSSPLVNTLTSSPPGTPKIKVEEDKEA